MLALTQKNRGARKFLYKNSQKIKGYEQYKLDSFNKIFQHSGKPVIAPQEALSGMANLVQTLWEAQ